MPEEIIVPVTLGVYHSPGFSEGKDTDLILLGPKSTYFENHYNVIAYNPWGTLDRSPYWLGVWNCGSQTFLTSIRLVSDTTGELLLWAGAQFHSNLYKELLSTGCLRQCLRDNIFIFK